MLPLYSLYMHTPRNSAAELHSTAVQHNAPRSRSKRSSLLYIGIVGRRHARALPRIEYRATQRGPAHHVTSSWWHIAPYRRAESARSPANCATPELLILTCRVSCSIQHECISRVQSHRVCSGRVRRSFGEVARGRQGEGGAAGRDGPGRALHVCQARHAVVPPQRPPHRTRERPSPQAPARHCHCQHILKP